MGFLDDDPFDATGELLSSAASSAWDFITGPIPGSPTWFPPIDLRPQPAGASVAPTVPLVENLGEMDREWGWTAPSAVLGGGGAGRAGRGSSLEGIAEALAAQNTGGLGDPDSFNRFLYRPVYGILSNPMYN